MTQYDKHEIMYIILRYLYRCDEHEVTPDESVIKPGGFIFDISHSYWSQIMSELVNKGLIKATKHTRIYPEEVFVTFSEPSITFAGIEFMYEDTMMINAAKSLKAKKFPPFQYFL